MIYFEYKHKEGNIENGIYQNFKLKVKKRKVNSLGTFLQYKKVTFNGYHVLQAWVEPNEYEAFRDGTIVDNIIKLGIKKSLRVLKLNRINKII